MVQLSLCMIVKNEEASLPQCLQSVANVVDEMIIVDTGSTDNTVTIAQNMGAKVYHFSWCNDFAVARNFGLQYAHGDWVLVLDADEVLTPAIIPQIQVAMEDEHNLVVNIIREEVGAIQSPYSLVSRLFRNHPQIRFSRPYHSMIDDSVTALLAQETHWRVISFETIAMLHYGYHPTAIASLDKYNRSKTIMEGFYRSHPHDPYVCTKLGALYLQIGETDKGIKLLKTGLKSNQASAPVLFELHYHLANAYTRQQNIEKAIKHYQSAIAQPILPLLKIGAYNNFGSLLQSEGDLENAVKLYQTAISIDSKFALVYYNLGMTYKAMGNIIEAINAYQQAIKLNPNYAFAYQNLGVVLLKIGKLPESLQAFQQAINLHEKDNPSEAQRLRQGLKQMGFSF